MKLLLFEIIYFFQQCLQTSTGHCIFTKKESHFWRFPYTAKKIQFVYSQKSNCAALFPISIFTHLWAIYIFPRFDPPILLQPDRQINCGNIQIAHRYMNIEIGTEAMQFPFWEYLCSNFRYSIFATYLKCCSCWPE